MKKLRFFIIFFCCLIALPALPRKKKGANYEPLFGKALASYTVTSNSLKGATFYLVGGHGGPDPGCIGRYQGKQLHEDEYAYDIILRLGRELLKRGAQVHFIIQDSKDGIRNQAVLNNSKRETCMGKSIPLNQVARLQQRCDAINRLYRKEKSSYKRAVFIHVDSRSQENKRILISIMPREANTENGWRRKFSARLNRNITGTSLTEVLKVR